MLIKMSNFRLHPRFFLILLTIFSSKLNKFHEHSQLLKQHVCIFIQNTTENLKNLKIYLNTFEFSKLLSNRFDE